MVAQAILFDLDGTLWDSYPVYAEVLARDQAHGIELLARLRSGENVFALAREIGFAGGRFKKRCVSSAKGLTLFDDVADVLEKLYKRGTPLGVVTSLPGTLAIPILRFHAIETLFGTIVHAGNCRYRKPSPKPLVFACEELGIAAGGDVFYVGDQPSDAESAINAGMSFAWASYGYGQGKPDNTARVLNRFVEVQEL